MRKDYGRQDDKQSKTTDDSQSANDSQSASYQSGLGDGESTTRGDSRKRGLWSSTQEHIIVTMSSHLGILEYGNYALMNIGDGGTAFQVFVAYMMIGIPASYMQMVLGQYTHMGVFLLKRMVPIADGAGFSYLLTIFFMSVFVESQMETIFLYILLTMVPGPLQWSTCGAPDCWEVWRQCEEAVPCINETVHIAAYVYWNVTYMKGLPSAEERRIRAPEADRVVVSFFTWVLIYLISLLSVARLKKFVRYAVVAHLISKATTAIMVLLIAGPVEAFTSLTVMSILNLSNLRAWKEAVVRVVVTMTLGDFSTVMMGALASDSAKIGTVAFLSGVLSFSSILIDDVTVTAASIALCKQVNLKLEDRYMLFHPNNAPLHLTLMPTTFELLIWPRLWNFIYFTNKNLAILFRVIFNILFLHEAVAHRFPTLASYRKYLSPMFCFAAYAVGVVFHAKEAFTISENFMRVNMYFCQYFNVMFFALMVSYVYGVRRFCDDVHFLRSAAPNLFWKITWVLLPVLLLLTLSVEYLERQNMFFTERLIEIVLIFSPYLCLTTFEVIKKIIERKTITLITPEVKWGPKEPDRRDKRRAFNPRKATRYITANLKCRHFCLAEHRLLKRLVTKEAQMMSRFGGPPRADIARSSSMELQLDSNMMLNFD